MSDLTGLIAISFLLPVTGLIGLWSTKMAHDLALQIITGVVRGMPLSPKTREGMLFHMWLPTEVGAAIFLAFGAFAFLEMADHVSGAGVQRLAHLGAFLSACCSAFVLVSSLFALFQYRAKLRRDQQS